MICNICGKREATVHLTEVVNDNVTKLHICEHCAKEKSLEMQSHFGLTDLLAGLMDFEPTMLSEGHISEDLKLSCHVCGMTFYDLQKSGRLGCGKCYERFESGISDLLKKIHGSDRHVGKMPLSRSRPAGAEEDLNKLKKELQELVSREEFEQAAVLRDRIKRIENGADR